MNTREDTRPRVLVIDDGETYARVVRDHLPELALVDPGKLGLGGRIPDGPAALEFLGSRRHQVDLILLDMNFDIPEDRLLPLGPGYTPRQVRRYQGMAILRELTRTAAGIPVVLLTSRANLSLGDLGDQVADRSLTYILDGDDIDTLRIRISAALQELAQPLDEASVHWGSDPAMRGLRRRLAILARGTMPVILEGETGTGKSFLARNFIHPNSGRSGPFVAVDLSTIPRDLVAAHLFGAVRGAYTGAVADRKGMFEMAHKGTLLLDEVQNIPLEVQRQLLLVLQERRFTPLGSSREIEVDVKVIAATNESLPKAVARGLFRRDLYMRLSPATRVVIPPLRERPEELAWLARRFAARALAEPEILELRDSLCRHLGLGTDAGIHLGLPGAREGRGAVGLSLDFPEPAWRSLMDHTWPGNVRELAGVMRNLVAFTLVDAEDAVRRGVRLSSGSFQVDPGLVSLLLSGSRGLDQGEEVAQEDGGEPGILDCIVPGATLNEVSNNLERACLRALFLKHRGDFGEMARVLLGDGGRARAVRLRFNQLGLKVRELSRES